MAQNSHDSPLLIAQTGPLDGQRWKMEGTLILGRGADCDIVIPMRQVSRQHARITMTADGARLEDLGSKNGTYHNGALLQGSVILTDGDEVQVSLAQHFVYLSSDATMPLEGLPPGLQRRRLRVDLGARRVWADQDEVAPPLSASQFNLLQALYEQPGEVVSRQEIIRAVWGNAAAGVTEQALDALVRRLRDRLAEADPAWEYIVTVRGHGLRLENPPITSD